MEFIFNIYDVHQQGAVNRDELAALLNHVPKSIMRFGRAVSLDGAHNADPHHHHHQHSHARHGHEGQQRRPSAPARHSPPSSAGTASGLSRGDEFGRCSPDRSSSGTGIGIGAALGPGGSASAATGAAMTATAASMASTAISGVAERGGARTIKLELVGGGGVATRGGDILGENNMNTPLTSGNLMQLHLASLSQSQGDEEEAGAGARAGARAGAGAASPRGVVAAASCSAEGRNGTALERAGGASSVEFSRSGRSSPAGLAMSPPSAGGGEALASCAAGGGATGACGTCVAHGAHGAGGLPLTSNASTGGDTEILHTVNGACGGGGAVSPSGDDLGTGPMISGHGAGGHSAAEKGVDGPRQGDSGRGEMSGAPGGGHAGGGGGVMGNTLHSDASTDDGTSAVAPEYPYHAHWEEFTNNDIVDQVCFIVCVCEKSAWLLVSSVKGYLTLL